MKNLKTLSSILMLILLSSSFCFAKDYKISTNINKYVYNKKHETDEIAHVQHYLEIRKADDQTSLNINFTDIKIEELSRSKEQVHKEFNKMKKTRITAKRNKSYQFDQMELVYEGTKYTTSDLLEFKSNDIPIHIKMLVKLIRQSIIFHYPTNPTVGNMFEIKHRKKTSAGESFSSSEVSPFKYYCVRDVSQKLMYIGQINKEFVWQGKNKGAKMISKKLRCFNNELKFFDCQKTDSYKVEDKASTTYKISLSPVSSSQNDK